MTFKIQLTRQPTPKYTVYAKSEVTVNTGSFPQSASQSCKTSHSLTNWAVSSVIPSQYLQMGSFIVPIILRGRFR